MKNFWLFPSPANPTSPLAFFLLLPSSPTLHSLDPKRTLLNGGTVAEDDQAGPHMVSGHAHGRSMNWPTSGHNRGEYLYLQLTY